MVQVTYWHGGRTVLYSTDIRALTMSVIRFLSLLTIHSHLWICIVFTLSQTQVFTEFLDSLHSCTSSFFTLALSHFSILLVCFDDLCVRDLC